MVDYYGLWPIIMKRLFLMIVACSEKMVVVIFPTVVLTVVCFCFYL